MGTRESSGDKGRPDKIDYLISQAFLEKVNKAEVIIGEMDDVSEDRGVLAQDGGPRRRAGVVPMDDWIRCPGCGSCDLRRSSSTTFTHWLFRIFRKRAFRCRSCDRRFYSSASQAGNSFGP